jgi:hypothetical protein
MDLDARLALEAWNLMGGLDWSALPTVAEILGVDDVETLARLVAHLRNDLRKD